MSTIREVQALKVLYEACPDARIRALAIHLVPDLAMIVTVDPNDVMLGDPGAILNLATAPRRRKFTARVNRGSDVKPDLQLLGETHVVCTNEALGDHRRGFAASFDLPASQVWVTVEDD
jgi:hypothetical protein